MIFLIRKHRTHSKYNINGKIVEENYNFCIRVVKNIFYFLLPRKLYLRVLPDYTDDSKNRFEFTENIDHASKFNTKELALSLIKDIKSNPNNYIES